MLIRCFIMWVTFVLVLATSATPAHSNNAWSVYHWARTTRSIDLIIVDSMTSEWQAEFDIRSVT